MNVSGAVRNSFIEIDQVDTTQWNAIVRADVWVFPCLNVYGIAGHTSGEMKGVVGLPAIPILGIERANRISPARSALDRGMKFTIHHDAPIAGAGMLPVVSIAVNRETSGGITLGPDQRISVYEAFRAITKDAACQSFEENRKGTLEAGKLADLVILDQDPLTVDPKKIADMKVLETIKEGTTVFRKE